MISLYNHTSNGSIIYDEQDTSLPSKARAFTLNPTSIPKWYNNSLNKIEITGITQEIPNISYSTTWNAGPTMDLTEKVKTVLENEVIKPFAMSHDNYKPVIVTDSWSQLYPKDGTFMSIPLSYRAYPKNMYNTLNYFDTLWYLINYTAPRKYTMSDHLEQVPNAMESAESKGIDIGANIKSIIDTINNNEKISWSNIAKGLKKNTTNNNDNDNTISLDEHEKAIIEKIKNIEDTLTKLITNEEFGTVRFSLEIPGLINKKYEKWLISSWSFKPAVQTTIQQINKKDVLCPIYIDFKITLRTAEKLTSETFNEIIINKIP